MTKKERIESVLNFILYRGYDLEFYYNNPKKYRIEMHGNCFKILYDATNAVCTFWTIGEDLYNNYLRKQKLNTIVEKING